MILQHGSGLTSLAVLKDGRLASGGLDGTIKVWTTEAAGEPIVLLHGGGGVTTNFGAVKALAVLVDGRLASAGSDGTIKLWPKEVTTDPVVLSQGVDVKALAVLADGRLASAGDDGKIKLWPREGAGGPVVLSQISGAACAVPTIGEGAVEHINAPPCSPLTAWVRVLADGRLASGGDLEGVKLWPTEGSGAPVALPTRGQVYSMAVLRDGRLAVGLRTGGIQLSPTDGTRAPTVLSPALSQGGFGAEFLAALADGGLAAGEWTGRIRLWPRLVVGESVDLLHRGRGGEALGSLVAMPDGRVVSGGGDGIIKIWPRDGRGEPAVLWHGTPVTSLAVLADGRLVSASGPDGKIRAWPTDGGGGEPVVLSHGAWVHSLAELPDGRLASGGGDGKVKLWLVDEQKLIAAVCLRAGRDLTVDEWNSYIGTDTPQRRSYDGLPSHWRTP
jgi:WD40 repeat protein